MVVNTIEFLFKNSMVFFDSFVDKKRDENSKFNTNLKVQVVCMLGWAKPDLWGLGGES